ncbi:MULTISPECIES: hypothetical protein [Vibrio]|uniref:Uncharacterized protein n=1 Tax=Vibrio metschnikovii TaxID=28172 RepID=A0A9X0RBL4_VIBME|nr:hypothetical protein [Vibrio metschnikovii]EKO3566996.1 hypothetical protein [Vibrio metschnikovii]EKO3771193.1 hypothetical protein [Vibrio metschnikovii]MBC5853402.1 hypothetical protein [Vibrio metschnikovii]MDA3140317.1 hypothetical protein [Vibrio metschnikovii]
MRSKLVTGMRDIVRVFFWCQHVHNYNYGGNKKDGVIWPFILTSSLIGIFIHGIYMLICLSVGMVTEQGFVLPYTVSWLLSACFTYLMCMKSEGFKQGETYFEPVKKNARRSTALSLSFLFTAICFSTRIGFFVLGFFGSLFR